MKKIINAIKFYIEYITDGLLASLATGLRFILYGDLVVSIIRGYYSTAIIVLIASLFSLSVQIIGCHFRYKTRMRIKAMSNIIDTNSDLDINDFLGEFPKEERIRILNDMIEVNNNFNDFLKEKLEEIEKDD